MKSGVRLGWAVTFKYSKEFDIPYLRSCVCQTPCDHRGVLDIYNTKQEALNNCGSADRVVRVEIKPKKS